MPFLLVVLESDPSGQPAIDALKADLHPDVKQRSELSEVLNYYSETTCGARPSGLPAGFCWRSAASLPSPRVTHPEWILRKYYAVGEGSVTRNGFVSPSDYALAYFFHFQGSPAGWA